jgi:hypothetical protein
MSDITLLAACLHMASGFIGYAFLLSVLTFPIGLFGRKNLENIDAPSSMGSLENDFRSNAYLVTNSTPS